MHIITDVQNLRLLPNASIREAAKVIQSQGIKIVLICNEENQLLGTVTDGDIRRAVLESIDIESSVSRIMNIKPKVVKPHEVNHKEALISHMRKMVIRHLPQVDEQGKVVCIYLIDGFEDPTLVDNPILLMAGGAGVRLQPLTHKIPKPLVEVGGKTVIEHLIEKLRYQGFWNFYISVNYLGHMIEEYLCDGSSLGVQINYLRETKPLGTAGCLTLLEGITKPIIVMNGDLIITENFRTILASLDPRAVASVGVKEYMNVIPYGCVELKDNRIFQICEKPVQKFLINAGAYILTPQVLNFVPKDTRYDMTDLLIFLIENNHLVDAFHLEEEWIDIGQKEDLARARNYLRSEVTVD